MLGNSHNIRLLSVVIISIKRQYDMNRQTVCSQEFKIMYMEFIITSFDSGPLYKASEQIHPSFIFLALIFKVAEWCSNRNDLWLRSHNWGPNGTECEMSCKQQTKTPYQHQNANFPLNTIITLSCRCEQSWSTSQCVICEFPAENRTSAVEHWSHCSFLVMSQWW